MSFDPADTDNIFPDVNEDAGSLMSQGPENESAQPGVNRYLTADTWIRKPNNTHVRLDTLLPVSLPDKGSAPLTLELVGSDAGKIAATHIVHGGEQLVRIVMLEDGTGIKGTDNLTVLRAQEDAAGKIAMAWSRLDQLVKGDTVVVNISRTKNGKLNFQLLPVQSNNHSGLESVFALITTAEDDAFLANNMLVHIPTK